MIQGHLMTKSILLSDGTMDCVVGLNNVVAQQEVEGVQVQHIQVCDPERSKLDIVPLSLKQYHSGVEIWKRFASKRCYSIDFCRGTILQILFWNITERKSVKIYRCSTLHMTPSLRSSKIIQRQKPKLKNNIKKTTTFIHSSTCVLSFLPFFFLTHRHVRTHTLAAVGPLSGDQRQSLDPPAPRWGQNLGQASTEPPSSYAARNTVPLSTGPERRAH